MTSEQRNRGIELLLKFYDLTESMMYLSNGIERYILALSDTSSLKALASVYVSSSEKFKKDYREVMSYIRNEIPEIPDNEWERLSAIDAKLSEHIDKLIGCFSKIILGKDLNYTVNNLRKEYRSLWGLIFANVFTSFARITSTDIVAKFYDLTESITYLSNTVQQSISESIKDTTLKALASVYVSSSEKFKKDYREVMSYIRNEIPEIPDNEWERLSAIDAKLSEHIDKLIYDFNNITDRKRDINSTMDNLRREYRSLWQEIFRNIMAKSRPQIDKVMSELEQISPTSPSTNTKDSKLNQILELLRGISDVGLQKAVSYSRFEQYDKAAEQYRLITKAYNEAYRKVINLEGNQVIQQPVLQSLLKTIQYWQRQEEDAMETYYSSQATKYKNEGKDFEARGLYSEALKSFEEALKFKPNSSDIWIKKGNTYSLLREFPDAITCYDRALSIDANNGNAWYNKGRCFIELKKYEDARECFERGIVINPNDYGAWWGKGNSFYFMGKYDEASICFDTAIAINPHEHILWFNKGMILFHRGEVEEAVKDFEKALEINPDSLPVRATLAEIMLMRKTYDKYEKLINEMRDLPESRDYEFGMRLLEVVYLSLNDRAKEAKKATMDLFDYYESIAEDPSTDLSLSNWDFGILRGMIEKSDVVSDKKSLLLSLASLPSVDGSDLDNLRAMTERIYKDYEKVDKPTEIVSPVRIRDIDIRIDNTSTRREDREGWYDWEIHIEPENVLPQIDYVQYILHPTFYKPMRKVEKSEGGFKLKGTGWGEFNVKVQVTLKNGRTITKYHWLHLDGPTPLDTSQYSTI